VYRLGLPHEAVRRPEKETEPMDESLIRAHLVASVLAADGRVTDAEREHLRGFLDSLELSVAQREAVEHFEGSADAIEAARALPLPQRRALLDELVAAALADAKLSAFELDLVKALGTLLDV
jgi:uncharacterized tellurite resistance protein B-like protein